MKNITKVAAAQLTPIFLNKEKTIEKACKAIQEASENGAKLIVFPEAFISAYPDWIWLIPNSKGAELNELYVQLVENAVSIPDDSTIKLCAAAKQAEISVVIGINERNAETSGTSLFNTLLFINEAGEITGKHRKLIPTGGERTIWAQGDGTTFKSHMTKAGKVAGLICWENYMPLARNAVYETGAQLLVCPTWDKSPNWLQSMQNNAREGGLFIISTCMALRKTDIPDTYDFKKLYPKDRDWINVGNSCIINPKGQIIAGPLEAKEGLLYADIDLNEITEAKRMFDVVGHYSRPDVFHFSVNNNPISSNSGMKVSSRANALAQRLLYGANALATLAEGLSDADWKKPVVGDGRTIGVVVHHVAKVYPLEIELAKHLAARKPITEASKELIDQMNAEHAEEFKNVGRLETIDLLRHNSSVAAASVRSFTDEALDNSANVSLNANAPLSAQFFIEDHALRHSFHHLEKIEATINLNL